MKNRKHIALVCALVLACSLILPASAAGSCFGPSCLGGTAASLPGCVQGWNLASPGCISEADQSVSCNALQSLPCLGGCLDLQDLGRCLERGSFPSCLTDNACFGGLFAWYIPGQTAPVTPSTPAEPEPPSTPDLPENPVEPTQPEEPAQQEESTQPETPAQEPAFSLPEQPDEPIEPAGPDIPAESEGPEVPAQPAEPAIPTDPVQPEPPAQPEVPEAPSAQADSFSSQARAILTLVNDYRAQYGLSPLVLDETLCTVAQVKAQDMHDNRYFSHESPTYGSPFDLMDRYGVRYRSAGENIAYGYASAQAVMTAWMNSEGHRANILSASYGKLGVGYVADGSYWVQEFTN